MKPMDNGALMREYETPDKEMEQAVQMIVTTVASEDPRYIERAPPSLGEEFPIDTKVFFLGEDAYGATAHISGVADTGLSVTLMVSGSCTYES
jgi:5'-3' exoribonuclease 1